LNSYLKIQLVACLLITRLEVGVTCPLVTCLMLGFINYADIGKNDLVLSSINFFIYFCFK